MIYYYELSFFMFLIFCYDKVKVDRVVIFINNLFYIKGKWVGKKFDLLLWQEQIVCDFFGIVKEDGNC